MRGGNRERAARRTSTPRYPLELVIDGPVRDALRTEYSS